MESNQIKWEDVYKLPIHSDDSKVYAFCENGTKALTFGFGEIFSDESDLVKRYDLRDEFIERVVKCINGESGPIEGVWSRTANVFEYNGHTAFIVRGWGYLIGIGGLHLPQEKAAEVQDGFCQYIEDKLTGNDSKRTD